MSLQYTKSLRKITLRKFHLRALRSLYAASTHNFNVTCIVRIGAVRKSELNIQLTSEHR